MAFVSPERIANTNERSAETPFDSMLDKPLSHPLLSTTGGAMADCRAVPTLLPSVFRWLPYLLPRQVAQELPRNHNSILLPPTSCHGNLTQPGKRETRVLTEILYGRLGSLSETLTHPICDCART